ncbi:MAG: efflux RND transporter periplasmic adaptor subunit [Dehalococcoidia bacterium]
MKKKLIVIIIVCAVVVSIAVPFAVARRASPREPLNTVAVTNGNIVKTVLVDGNVVMPNKAYLSFGATGTVKEVLVDKGNNVTKGQILARLDAESLQLSVNTAELQVKIAEAQLDAAEEQYEIALIYLDKAGTPGMEPKDVLKARVDIAKENLEMARLSLKIAKNNLELAKLNLEKAEIVAPFDGVVADVTITEGKDISTAALATQGISLVDTSKIEMHGYIDEIDVAMVKVGQAANITLDALPDIEIAGEVAFVSPTGTIRAGVISYEAIISLEDPPEELRDGMTATAQVIIERRDNVLLVPNRAISGTRENPVVTVYKEGSQEQREVTLGLTDGKYTEVLSGLEEGEYVIIPQSEKAPSLFDFS